MPVLSYVHQLFNARPVSRLHPYAAVERSSPPMSPVPEPGRRSLGHVPLPPGLQRYWCKRTASAPSMTSPNPAPQSKRSLPHWILATFLLCLSCSSRRIARELGVHIRTSYRWCWWLRNAALSYEMERQLEGTVEADDLYHTAGHKGQAKQGGKKSLGRTPTGAPQEARARAGPLRQRPARHYRLGQSPGRRS